MLVSCELKAFLFISFMSCLLSSVTWRPDLAQSPAGHFLLNLLCSSYLRNNPLPALPVSERCLIFRANPQAQERAWSVSGLSRGTRRCSSPCKDFRHAEQRDELVGAHGKRLLFFNAHFPGRTETY